MLIIVGPLLFLVALCFWLYTENRLRARYITTEMLSLLDSPELKFGLSTFSLRGLYEDRPVLIRTPLLASSRSAVVLRATPLTIPKKLPFLMGDYPSLPHGYRLDKKGVYGNKLRMFSLWPLLASNDVLPAATAKELLHELITACKEVENGNYEV